MNDVVKEKEWIGYWWLPGQEENKIPSFRAMARP